MNKITVSVVSCLCVLLSGFEAGHSATPVIKDSAYIYFTGKNDQDEPGGKSCSLPIERGDTPMGDTACKNDEVYYYRFDNVPSATLITLDAENECRDASNPGDWQFTLRSYINPTTTGWRKVSDLQSLKSGDIVTAGVMYEQGYYKKGDVAGKLSCVRIQY
ncbi:hypothetical protein G7009_27130 [Pseudomonas capeferrum]|uniref:hypothetical protein n=1 Tax=Pseudomonas capeferrum TaxID=1495066 RepID=UPI0015E36B9D|nr:hypothetical protein [Pseudomonas capeferrum]MBA1205384.1 hypothetical protein [Pseudomonas capeferrum]